ncbi:MAG: DUF1302 family protein, partial [Gammaproteobacteria bacterium]
SREGKSMAGQHISCEHIKRGFALVVAAVLGLVLTSTATAWQSKDGSLVAHGFADYTHHQREGYGMVKNRMRGQLEINKDFGSFGIFRGVSLNSVIRLTHDGVHDWNDSRFGDEAGGSVLGSSSGVPVGSALGLETPWGASPVNVAAGLPLPGGSNFVFDLGANPNSGLKKVGGELGHRANNGQFGGGLEFFAPVRPCNVDSRGCITDYMDADEDDLRNPEFTSEHRWLRELYLDATLPFSNGDEINFRIGRQQVVWGRTDLFRVLDQINPIDFSIQNIYEEFEDSRIPLGIVNMEWRLGGTALFSDLNFQFLWNFEQFKPHNLGQGGQPYNILQAGDLFRSLKNCWDNGCTVSNFASGLSPAGNLATDFPAHVIGIRNIHIPDGGDQFGLRMEGVFKSVGFSINAATYHSQLPSLRAGIPSQNPFLAVGTPHPVTGELGGVEAARSGVPAFDIHFPRILLVGTSADLYVDYIKSAFRIELAWTEGEEFADTSKTRLFSESDVIRWVVGWDRPTYIRFLNPNRTFLLSGQIFGQHLLDHERFSNPRPEIGTAPAPSPGVGNGGMIGFQDWDHNFIGTFLIQGFYANDRIQPRFITAYDIRAQAGVIGPAIDWLVSDSWRVTFGANIKFGRSRNITDDGRTNNGAAPFTAGTACTGTEPACVPGLDDFASLGSRIGFEPLGRFRSGPIGMAQHEDEVQLLLRYRF